MVRDYGKWSQCGGDLNVLLVSKWSLISCKLMGKLLTVNSLMILFFSVSSLKSSSIENDVGLVNYDAIWVWIADKAKNKLSGMAVQRCRVGFALNLDFQRIHVSSVVALLTYWTDPDWNGFELTLVQTRLVRMYFAISAAVCHVWSHFMCEGFLPV